MTNQEVAQILEGMANSLRENPSQFQFTVHVTTIGASGTAYGGGVGMMGIAQGGGTGIHASASTGSTQVGIAQKRGESAMGQKIQALADQLSAMAQEMKNDSPDKSKMEKMYESLKATWVPGVISSVVGNLLTATFLR